METDIRLQARIDELERRVNFLYERLNIPYSTGGIPFQDDPRLLAAIRSGNKIEAIKVYRELTDCELVEAKNAVESMWGNYRV